MALSTRSLRIFSAVEVLREGQADIRFALAPLFQPDLAKYNGEVFDSRKLSSEINAQYRLNVNRDVVEEFIPVFLDLGWLRRIEIQEHAYLVTCEPSDDVTAHRGEFESKASELARTFREFIHSLSPLSQVDKSDEELIDALVDWLISLDVLSEEDLRSVAQVERIGKKLVYKVQEPEEVRADDMSYLCARFVHHIVDSGSELEHFLIELASVGLITEVVRDFQKPSTSVARTDLAVYLDAPVALDLLGLSGREAKDNIQTILDKIRALGGSVRIHRISIDEMQTSLSAMLNRRPQDREGATAEALRRNEVLEAFVRQVATLPDPFLREAGVAILDQSLDQFPNEHRFFERAAVDELYSQIGWVRDDAPRFHDASTAALTMRKRTGARSSDIFEVKHVMLTRNPFFPSLARRTSIAHNYINAQQVGPVVHQRQLATAVWLRTGLSKSDETIPRRYILSACRRVLTLRRNIVERVRQVSQGLSSDQTEQLELLLTQGRSTQVLMDKTLGAEHVIDSSNIAILVEEMKRALVSDVRTEAEEAIRRAKSEAGRRSNELKARVSQSETDVATLRAALDHEAAARTRVEAEITASIVRRINRKARYRRLRYGALCLSIVILAEIAGFFGSGLTGYALIGALVLVTLAASALFLKEKIQARLFDPLFQKGDEELLWREASEAGLDPQQVESKTRYVRGQFELTP
jgi:hypothetical protein